MNKIMKGGVRYDKIDEAVYLQIIERFREEYIPIPSQKRGICLTDALMSVLWYTDGIRGQLWEQYLHDKEIISDCETRLLELEDAQLADCFFQLSGVRVAGILAPVVCEGGGGGCSASSSSSSSSSPPPSLPLMRVTIKDGRPVVPPEPQELQTMNFEPVRKLQNVKPLAMGELCSIVYDAFDKKTRGSVDDSIFAKTEFGLMETQVGPLIQKAVTTAKITDIQVSNVFPTNNKSAEIVAVFCTLNVPKNKFTPQGAHSVAMCKINDNWHYLDNNVGYSLPMFPQKFDEMDRELRAIRELGNFNNYIKLLQLEEELQYVDDTIFYTVYDGTHKGMPLFKTGSSRLNDFNQGVTKAVWVEDVSRRIYVYRTKSVPALQNPVVIANDNPLFVRLEQSLHQLQVFVPEYEGTYTVTYTRDPDTDIITIRSEDEDINQLQIRPFRQGEDEDVEFELDGQPMVQLFYVLEVNVHPYDGTYLVTYTRIPNTDIITIDSENEAINQLQIRPFRQGEDEDVEFKLDGQPMVRAEVFQVGGIRGQITQEQYKKIQKKFADAGRLVRIPIPSQKNGICAVDAVQASFWYTDGIRDVLWNKAVGRGLTAERNDLTTEPPDTILQRWAITTGLRVAGIIQTPIRDFKRQPSLTQEELNRLVQAEDFGTTGSVGNECGILFNAYLSRILNREVALNMDWFGVNFSEIGLIMSGIWEGLDLSQEFGWGYSVPQGDETLAIIFSTGFVPVGLQRERTGGHTVAVCKISGRWWFLDNEIGITVPINVGINVLGYNPLGIRYNEKANQTLEEAQLIRWDGETVIPLSGSYPLARHSNRTHDTDQTYDYREQNRIYFYRRARQHQAQPYLIVDDNYIPVQVEEKDGMYRVTREGAAPEIYQRVTSSKGDSITQLQIGDEQFPVASPSSLLRLTSRDRKRIETQVQQKIAQQLTPKLDPETGELRRGLPQNPKFIERVRKWLRNNLTRRVRAEKQLQSNIKEQQDQPRFQPTRPGTLFRGNNPPQEFEVETLVMNAEYLLSREGIAPIIVKRVEGGNSSTQLQIGNQRFPVEIIRQGGRRKTYRRRKTNATDKVKKAQ